MNTHIHIFFLLNYEFLCRCGRTCLHHAAHNGHAEMVEWLIQVGCVINASDKKDRRALHFAAFNGHDEVMRTLIAKGAEIDVKVRIFPNRLLNIYFIYIHIYLYIYIFSISIC